MRARHRAVAEPGRVVQRLGFQCVLADPAGFGSGLAGGLGGRAATSAGGDQPRLGDHPGRLVDGDLSPGVFLGVGQYPAGLFGLAERGVGAGQQQPRRQSPRQ